jgi:putative isomerase
MMLAFAHQSPQGQLPASFNNAELHWMDAKPPVHGWTLGKLMRETDWVGIGKLHEIYEPLVAFTEWWFRFRDHDGDGLPAAFHGNDTGWDNASVFDERPPVTTPDLSAYLVIQMEVLSKVAELLGRDKEALEWQQRGEALLKLMIERMWDAEKGQFVSLTADSQGTAPGDSLINFIPVVLGRRLPQEILQAMVRSLMQPGRFLTDWGLATESVESPFYNAEGYWRGPIWAPSTLLIWDGLREAGYKEEADTVRERFLALCAKAGFAENFQATEGRSLRDPTYTWTASSFLYLLSV